MFSFLTLDLSLPLATEKSPLPAIIVTPSSPSSNRDFSIAFLADPPKPTLIQRFMSIKGPVSSAQTNFRLRSIIFLLVLIFILVCHLVTHNLAARHPRLDLTGQTGEARLTGFDIKAFFGREPVADDKNHVYLKIVEPDAPGARWTIEPAGSLLTYMG